MKREEAIGHAREYLKSKGLKAWQYEHFSKASERQGTYWITACIMYQPGRTMDLVVYPDGKVEHA